MTNQDKEKLVNRLLSSFFRIRIGKNTYWVHTPTPQQKLESSYLYEDVLREAESNGVLSREEYLTKSYELGYWDDKKEKELKTANDNLEKLKIEYYKNCFKKSKRELAESGILKTKIYQYSLTQQKEKNYCYSAESIAETAKYKYLLSKCLYHEDNKTPVWVNTSYTDNELLNNAYLIWSNLRLTDSEIRELARSDCWRSYWSCRKECQSLLDVSSAHLSDEQKAVIAWSRMYDGAYEDPDFFGEVAIENDDMFDGYLLLRRKERDKQNKKSRVEASLANSKNKDFGEVFIVAESEEEVKEIEEMNDEQAAGIKKERIVQIQTKGTIHEAQMPDSQRDIMKAYAEKFRGRK